MKLTLKRTWLWVGVAVLALAFLYLPALGIGGGQLLAFLLVLLCPLLHFFGMHRHGSHGGGEPGAPGPPAPAAPPVRASDPHPGPLPPRERESG